jgi:hypothetical protein
MIAPSTTDHRMSENQCSTPRNEGPWDYEEGVVSLLGNRSSDSGCESAEGTEDS